MMSNNLIRLRKVADGLGGLSENVVFVGGSVAELYADDPAATEIRMTNDVDCVIELTTYKGFYELETAIRKLGFVNDTSKGAPICRWVYNGEVVDIMPDDEEILGFTNRWYKPAFSRRVSVCLPDGTSVYVFPVLYYMATKIEAISGRGGEDLRWSHDFEDLVYVLNNCSLVKEAFEKENDGELKQFISDWARNALIRQNFSEEIECALPYGDTDRIVYILDIIQTFAKYRVQ